LDAPAHADGKRRQVRSTHRTLTAAREHVESHRSDRSRGVLVTPNREAFNQAADDYISRKERQRREVTVTSYKAAFTHP
jgi:hypothetical protein